MFYAGDVDEFVAVRHRRVKGLRICLRGNNSRGLLLGLDLTSCPETLILFPAFP